MPLFDAVPEADDSMVAQAAEIMRDLSLKADAEHDPDILEAWMWKLIMT